MKNYIVLDIYGKPQVICPRGWIPSDVICEAPAEYDPNLDDGDCLVLEDNVASVDLEKQSASRAAKAAAKAEMIAAQPMKRLRSERNQLLLFSDWTQRPGGPLSDEKKAEWAAYMQELRDLPQNTEDPSNPVWPTKPS